MGRKRVKDLLSDVVVKEHELWEGSNKNVKKSSLDAVANDIKTLVNDGYTVEVLYSISDVKSVLIIGTKEGSVSDSVTGGDGEESISGGTDTDVTIIGGSDTDDTVTGGDGDDTVPAGDDTLSGGTDTDTLPSGDGDDTVSGNE